MIEDSPKHWVGGICIRQGSILLIYRINKERNFHQEYFVFPGGAVEDDESIEDALEREMAEASLTVKIGDLFYESSGDNNDDKEFYYICEYITGEPQLSMKSREAETMKEGGQFYTPMWVPLRELEDLIVYPETIKNKILFELGDQ